MLNALHAVTQQHFNKVLDVGCGTGLFGEVIRAECNELHGIDIAAGMIKEAQKITAYDHLQVSDVSTFCATTPFYYDLIAACGCFQFVSDLNDVIGMITQRLNTGGFLVFSVDDGEVSGLNPQTPSGLMYAHNRQDVINACAAHNLSVHHEVVLRDRNRKPTAQPILCRYVVAQKNG